MNDGKKVIDRYVQIKYNSSDNNKIVEKRKFCYFSFKRKGKLMFINCNFKSSRLLQIVFLKAHQVLLQNWLTMTTVSVIDDDTDHLLTSISFEKVKDTVCYEFMNDTDKANLITFDGEVIVEKTLPSLFEHDIPFRSGLKLLEINSSLQVIENNIPNGLRVSETMQNSSLFIIFVLSCQRGPESGCPYQVPINCRSMSIHHLVTNQNGNNLMESAIQHSLQNSFGEGDLSALTFFGVSEDNMKIGDDYCKFQMPSKMNINLSDSFLVEDAVLQGRQAIKLSGKHFKRACRFFNRVWGTMDDDGNLLEYPDDHPVTSRDLHAFVMLFKEHQLGTEKGWTDFLTDFRLHAMFPFKKDEHALVQIRRLGEYYRSLVPLDCGISRGQHRCHALGFLGTGYFDCCKRAPLIRFNGGKYMFLNFGLLKI